MLLAAMPLQAQTFTVLYAFTGGSDGGHPTRLTMDAAGNLYGSSQLEGKQGGDCQFGGAHRCGADQNPTQADTDWAGPSQPVKPSKHERPWASGSAFSHP